MRKTKLDSRLLIKIAEATGKCLQSVREQTSRRAGKLGVSSLAAELLWAQSLKIGIAHALRMAEQNVKDEVRDGIRSASIVANPNTANTFKHTTGIRPPRKDRALHVKTVDFLLEDPELRTRCRDLILASKHHDRAVREATTVLEDRIKKLSGVTNLTSGPLLSKALNPEPSKAVIVVSGEKEGQAGMFYICNGIMQVFRNKTHHNLSDAFTQADALKFCGFIDTILSIVGQGQVLPECV